MAKTLTFGRKSIFRGKDGGNFNGDLTKQAGKKFEQGKKLLRGLTGRKRASDADTMEAIIRSWDGSFASDIFEEAPCPPMKSGTSSPTKTRKNEKKKRP